MPLLPPCTNSAGNSYFFKKGSYLCLLCKTKFFEENSCLYRKGRYSCVIPKTTDDSKISSLALDRKYHGE